jgi:hypothetical protein
VFERLRPFLPLGLFLFAFLFRLIGIGWGLPSDLRHQSLHPDEQVIYTHAQQIEPARLNFEPGFYNYGTLYLTVLSVASDMVGVYGEGIHPERPDTVWRHIGATHLAGRMISALAGAGTVLIVFLMMRRFLTPFGASMAALLIALAPGHVVHSRFQTVDVLATFFLACSAYFALRMLLPTTAAHDHEPTTEEAKPASEEPNLLKLAIWSGVFAGLSAGTKYTGVLGLLTLLVVVLLAHRPRSLKLFGAGTGAALLVFLITTPGVLLNTSKFWRDFAYEMQHVATGHGLIFEGYRNGFLFHIFNLIIGVGAILTLLGLIGLGISSFRRYAWALALLAFFLPYFILIGRAEVLFLRYTFPLYIGLAAGFGWLMDWGHGRQKWGVAAVVFGIVGLGGLDFGGMRGSAVMTGWMAGEDPRDSAARYLMEQAQGQPDATVGLATDPWFYTPPLYPEVGLPRWVPFTERHRLMLEAEAPRVVRYVPEVPDERFDFDSRLLTELQPDFVVVSHFEFQDPLRLHGRADVSDVARLQGQRAADFFQLLQKDYRLDRVFGAPEMRVHDLQYIRPYIQVWRRLTP